MMNGGSKFKGWEGVVRDLLYVSVINNYASTPDDFALCLHQGGSQAGREFHPREEF